MDISKVRSMPRKITPVEQLFAWSPFSTVTLVARIKGYVSEDMLWNAVLKVQQRHIPLQSKIVERDGELWFSTEDVGPISIGFIPREKEDDWIAITQAASTRPYLFDQQPPIRFILVQAPEVSELVIQCHHIICDGISLAFLARDLMDFLGNPELPVEVLPVPVPIGKDNIPKEAALNSVVKFFVNRINKKWLPEKVVFDQQDYLDLTQAYWKNFTHRMVPIELNETQTEALVARCREEGVTVNTALVAAFVGAARTVLGEASPGKNVGVAASLRERLNPPANEGMGFYAGAVTTDILFNLGIGFWENARKIHKMLVPQFNDRQLFAEMSMWSQLDPSIMAGINFKKLGGFVTDEADRYDKLSVFSQRDDVVLSVLKRNKTESLDQIIMGTAVTNLTRLDFPRIYGSLELDRLILKPGGAFPLMNVHLVVGAVTASGKLSLLVEFCQERTEDRKIKMIKNQAVTYLLGE